MGTASKSSARWLLVLILFVVQLAEHCLELLRYRQPQVRGLIYIRFATPEPGHRLKYSSESILSLCCLRTHSTTDPSACSSLLVIL